MLFRSPLDSLQPGVANRVRNQDIRCDSLAEAYELVGTYRANAAENGQVPQAGGSDAEGADGTDGAASSAADAAGSDASSASSSASAAAAAHPGAASAGA